MRWRLAALGLLAYAIALLAGAPAGLLDAGMNSASKGGLRLTEAQGGLWSGAGRLEIRSSGGRTLAAQGLRWRLLPIRLLRAELAFELQLEHSPRALVMALGSQGVEIFDADVNLPAAAFAAAEPKLAPLQLTGELSLRSAQLSIASGGWTGSATLQWRNAGSALTTVYPLGDYELRFVGEGRAGQFSLLTLKGPLSLEGKGSLPPGQKAALALNARIDPASRAALEPLMRLIAVERSDGSFELRLD